MGDIVVQKICPFCKVPSRTWGMAGVFNYFGYDCVICKQFFISNRIIEKIINKKIDNEILNCISENIKSNSKEGEVITSWHSVEETSLPKMSESITVKRFESVAAIPIIHSEKPVALLLKIGEKLFNKSPVESVNLSKSDLYEIKIVDLEEAIYWLKTCKSSGYLASNRLRAVEATMGWDFATLTIESFDLSLTPSGWDIIFRNRQAANSKKVFIAMQFNWEKDIEEKKGKFIGALKKGCADCGYEADLVSQDHTDQITDRIIAEIKSSRFVIADFTYNNPGAYYEAGLARGLGLKVIHTVMKGHTFDQEDSAKRLHFDIRQINYLEWDNPEEVAEKIKNRIKAVIEN